MKMLFAYLLTKGSTTYELFNAFKRNPMIDVAYLFQDLDIKNSIYSEKKRSVFSKIMNKIKLPLDTIALNKRLELYDFTDADILFTVKGNTIKPWILAKIKQKYPHLKIISWSQDDMIAWHNRSLYYTYGLKYYDLVVTQKSYNIKELKSIGVKNVLFQNKAYSKDVHKPCEDCSDIKDKADVLFIGHFEEERFEDMLFLAKNGIKVDVYGPAWQRYMNIEKNLVIHNKMLSGSDYSNAISCSKISLCFLRKINRDLQTSRSIEIQACGGFMIAERTEEHKKLFLEDEEAVFFETKEELFEKVFYYLNNEEKREIIAKNGYRRVKESNYSYDDRVDEIVEFIKRELLCVE